MEIWAEKAPTVVCGMKMGGQNKKQRESSNGFVRNANLVIINPHLSSLGQPPIAPNQTQAERSGALDLDAPDPIATMSDEEFLCLRPHSNVDNKRLGELIGLVLERLLILRGEKCKIGNIWETICCVEVNMPKRSVGATRGDLGFHRYRENEGKPKK